MCRHWFRWYYPAHRYRVCKRCGETQAFQYHIPKREADWISLRFDLWKQEAEADMKLEKAEKRKEKLLDKANKEAEIENRPKVLAWIREVRKK